MGLSFPAGFAWKHSSKCGPACNAVVFVRWVLYIGRVMHFLARLVSLVGSAKSIRAGIQKAQTVAAQVKQTVENYETASFHESLRQAEQGSASAQYDTGEDYYFGRTAPQDYAEALRWFLKAAEQGHTQAQANVGMLYALGRGVRQDYLEAFKWVSLAAAHGNEGAKKTQEVVLGKLSREQREEAERQVSEFLTRKRVSAVKPTRRKSDS
ncbi:MAG: sel1 repeat family protein [Verrucomicrobia bacterium]|nr:sel1 repeat family protein [Verrucomicrobiota bacterium]